MRRKKNFAWAKKSELLRAAFILFCVVRRTDAQPVHSVETLSEVDSSNVKFWESKARMAERGVEEFNLSSAESQPISRHYSRGC